MPLTRGMDNETLRAPGTEAAASHLNPVLPFLLGAAVGGAAGAVAGTLLGKQTTQLVASLIGVVDRRLARSEEGEPRFDLLLQ
ncbi:MAG: hypothetical protein M3Q03_05115 [Chloroflexota bacterium]|nr:hypothetical protein [Chloroflexota bacterium]